MITNTYEQDVFGTPLGPPTSNANQNIAEYSTRKHTNNSSHVTVWLAFFLLIDAAYKKCTHQPPPTEAIGYFGSCLH